MFLEISENSKENTCARVSVLIKLQTFYTEHLRTTASSDIIYLKYKFEQIDPRIKASLNLHENYHTRQLEESDSKYDMIKRYECSTSVDSSVQHLSDRHENLLSS